MRRMIVLAFACLTLLVPAGASASFEDGGAGGTHCVWRTDHTLLVCCNSAGCTWYP